MKLTKSRLKRIIREEISQLKEYMRGGVSVANPGPLRKPDPNIFQRLFRMETDDAAHAIAELERQLEAFQEQFDDLGEAPSTSQVQDLKEPVEKYFSELEEFPVGKISDGDQQQRFTNARYKIGQIKWKVRELHGGAEHRDRTEGYAEDERQRERNAEEDRKREWKAGAGQRRKDAEEDRERDRRERELNYRPNAYNLGTPRMSGAMEEAVYRKLLSKIARARKKTK